MGALGWSTAFDLVSSPVLQAVESGHTEHDEETKACESDVDRAAFLELRLLLCREQESSGKRQALAERVEHTEASSPLRLVTCVTGYP